MFTRRTVLVIAFVIALLLVAGIGTGSGAIAHGLVSTQPGLTIPYPGHLANASGQPVADGSYSFVFELYDAENGGTRLWSETQQNVLVKGGAFAVTLGAFNSVPAGQPEEGKRWLSVAVRGPGETGYTPLTPRQPLGVGACGVFPSAPSAAACPHDHLGEVWNANIGWSGAGLRINNSSNGPSFWGMNSGGGNGVRGDGAGTSIGVYGQGQQGPGAVGRSADGHGVEGYSTNKTAVYGVSDKATGVYGKGGPSASGVFGASGSSSGLALYGYGDMRVEGNIYVAGNISAGGSKVGYVVDVAQNDDSFALELGDLVVISGAGPAVLGEIPVVKVRRAQVTESASVVGIVDQHYTPGTKEIIREPKDMEDLGIVKSTTDNTAIPPQQYLTVATHGSFKAIKVDASFGAISPGDLLVASSNPGYAMKAISPKPGTIIGKSLGALASGTGVIPVMVTLQ